MKLARKSLLILHVLVMPLTEVSARLSDDLHYNMVFDTPEITIAAGVAYDLTATFSTRLNFKPLTLGTIFPASDDCIYTRYETWSDITTTRGKCSDLGEKLGEKNSLQINPVELFSQRFQGPIDLFSGGLEVKLSPVRAGHKLQKRSLKSGVTEPIYAPEGQVTSDTGGDGYEVLEFVSCSQEHYSNPREVECKKGFWMDAASVAWPGNLMNRKLNVNVQTLDDGGMILTFYNFQEKQHGLNIYTYDPREKSKKNQYKDLRIVVRKNSLSIPGTANINSAVNSTTPYNSTPRIHNNSGIFTTTAPTNIVKIITALFVVAKASIY